MKKLPPPHFVLRILSLALLIFFSLTTNKMKAQAPELCDPPVPITNGDFEDTGTCNTGVTCNLNAFNSNGCGVPDWIEGYGTPDLCQESGNWYAKMETVGGNCGTEGIVTTLDLVPDCKYELSFRHRTEILNGTGVNINIYLVSGFTHLSPPPASYSPCPTPDPGWTLVGTISNFSSSTWAQASSIFSFVAPSSNPQLLFYPLPVGGSDAAIDWHLDDVELSPCMSNLNPAFNAELIGDNEYQFNDLTVGNVVDWCWDFGDGNFSTDENPVHEYSGSGPYTVCLTILDNLGCKATICQTIGSPCGCGTASLTLSSNETWTGQTINIGNTLIIPSGRTLTVDASTVNVATGCGIIVRNGARLNVLEGSTLQAWCEDGLWNGIRVLGGSPNDHPTASAIGTAGVPGTYPTSTSQHGVVYAYGTGQDPTTIRDAEIAIGNSSGFVLGAGGIIVADGVTFTENQLSGDIRPFPNLATPGGPVVAPNVSRFLNCSFDLNLNDPPNIPTAQGIRIRGSNSVLVKGCTFTGLGDDAITGTDHTATIQGCTFQGEIPVAVRVQQTPSLPQAFKFIVGGGEGAGNTFTNTNTASFLNNSVGMTATAVSNLLVSHNTFETTIGVSILGDNSGFEVTDNIFNEEETGWTGVIINQTGPNLLNKSQCNQYLDLGLWGIVAWGDNEGYDFNQEYFDDGLPWDVYVAQLQSAEGKINNQGSHGAAYFNWFANTTDIFANPGETQKFFYFFPENAAQTYPELRPECDLEDGCTLYAHNFKNEKTDNGFEEPDGCLDLEGIEGGSPGDVVVLPDGGGEIRVPLTPDIPKMSTDTDDPVFSGFTCDTFTCLTTIRSKITELTGMVDGGNTNGLLTAIGTSPNTDATKDLLLVASPYLSDTVLLAYVQNGTTSVARKETVLLANAPVSDTVFSAADGVVTSQVLQDLEDERDSVVVSPMEHLHMMTHNLLRIKNRVTGAFIQKYYESGDSLSLVQMLLQDSSEFATRKLTGFYLQVGDFAAAQAILDVLPAANAEQQEYKYLQQINLYRLADSTFTLSQGQEDTLFLSANGATTQAALAKALLTVMKDTIFPIEVPEEIEERSANGEAFNIEQTGANDSQVTIVPNPASDEITVRLPAGFRETDLKIYAMNGVSMAEKKVTGRLVTFPIGHLPQGVYFLQASSGAIKKQARFVIQR